jgi:outer membrane protein assembly factor BamB
MRRVLTSAAVVLAVLLVVGGALHFFFGLGIVLDGGGMPRLRFVESADEQAARIARHRAEQRARFESQPATPAAAVRASPENLASATPSVPAPAGPEAGTPLDEESSAAPSSAAGATPLVMAAYWTDFRGPQRDGHYREVEVLTRWPSTGLAPMWKQPAGGGYASFSIARGRAFTIEQRGREEVVAAYDVETGRELWTNSWTGDFRESMGGDGPRATPVWWDGRVYALGAEGELRALDERTGTTLWRTNILGDARTDNLQWGMAASPIVVDGLVIVQPGGGSTRQALAAYDARTGEPRWQALDDRQSYASPMVATLAGRRQLLVLTAERLLGFDPATQEVLWEFAWPGPNGINAAQPLVLGDDRVFLSSGYGMGAAVIQISGDGSGFAAREVWRNNRMKNRFASSVLHEGYIYGLDESILACIDAATGELVWKGGRYGYGQLLLADGHLVVLTEDGDLALVRATPQGHEELARFPVLNGKTWNVPAIASGVLLVRNLGEMAAFDLRR